MGTVQQPWETVIPNDTFPFDVFQRSGLYVHGGIGQLGTTGLSTLNRIYFVPIFYGKRLTLNQWTVNVTGAAAAGGVLRGGLYTDNQGVPGNLIADFGTLPSDAVAQPAAAINITAGPGIVWHALGPQVAITPIVDSFTATAFPLIRSGVGQIGSVTQDAIAGALPSVVSVNSESALAPALYARIV